MDISRELTLVDEALRAALRSDVDLLATATEYVIRSGGKRLRPRIVLYSHRAVGGEEASSAVPLAAAVELLHTASIIHDDIIDHSDIRRGQTTLNSQWGNNLALLTGDFVFVKLLELMTTFEPCMIRVLVDSCISLVEGEMRQMSAMWATRMTEETYLKIAGEKTAALLAASAELGAMSGGGTAEEVSALRDYGLKLGMAFQIRDDILDSGDGVEEVGETVASGLAQGEMLLTSPFAAPNSGKPVEASGPPSVDAVRTPLRDTITINYAILRADDYREKAKAALLSLPPSDARVALYALADFALDRDG